MNGLPTQGYPELRADGQIRKTSEELRLDRFREHDVEVVIGGLDKSGTAWMGKEGSICAPAHPA